MNNISGLGFVEFFAVIDSFMLKGTRDLNIKNLSRFKFKPGP